MFGLLCEQSEGSPVPDGELCERGAHGGVRAPSRAGGRVLPGQAPSRRGLGGFLLDGEGGALLCQGVS